MTTRFTLRIKLGNAMMRNGSDIAHALREISFDPRLADAEPLDEDNNFVAQHSRETGVIDDNGALVGAWSITEQLTDMEIAQQVLDNHVIKPDWKRSGEQIIDLLAEAVAITRGEQ